jgi:hypothetical protein
MVTREREWIFFANKAVRHEVFQKQIKLSCFYLSRAFVPKIFANRFFLAQCYFPSLQNTQSKNIKKTLKWDGTARRASCNNK